MSLKWPARPIFLAWSNPLAWWWCLLLLVSGANIAVWFLLYHYLQERRIEPLRSTSEIELMLFLSAAYVLVAHSDRSCRAQIFSGSVCLIPGCRVQPLAGRSQP